MKKKTLTPKTKAKKLKTKIAPKAHVSKRKVATGVYAKRIFVRFASPELKELVRKHADLTHVSLSAYIANAAVKAAKEGWKLELKPQAVAA